MAKESMKAREVKRAKMVAKYASGAWMPYPLWSLAAAAVPSRC